MFIPIISHPKRRNFDLFSLDGNFLAIGSHDNYIYIYAVAENGRKYSRVGKCSVSSVFFTLPSSPSPLWVISLILIPLIPRQGHSSFITHLDWSVDSQYLVSNSGDYEILYCKYGRLNKAYCRGARLLSCDL